VDELCFSNPGAVGSTGQHKPSPKARRGAGGQPRGGGGGEGERDRSGKMGGGTILSKSIPAERGELRESRYF